MALGEAWGDEEEAVGEGGGSEQEEEGAWGSPLPGAMRVMRGGGARERGGGIEGEMLRGSGRGFGLGFRRVRWA